MPSNPNVPHPDQELPGDKPGKGKPDDTGKPDDPGKSEAPGQQKPKPNQDLPETPAE